MAAVGRIRARCGRVPLRDVVVVHASVRHRQLVVVGEQDEQRQVGEHHSGVDAVEVHVPDDVLGLAVRGGPAELPVLGDRPAVEADRMQLLELRVPALHQRLFEGELLFPESLLAQVAGQPGPEEVGRLDDVRIAGDDELLEHGPYLTSFSHMLGNPIVGCPCKF